MNTALPVAGALLAVALVGGCGSGSAENDAAEPLSLEGRTFLGDDVTREGKPFSLVDDSVVRLSFQDGTVGASAGCNQMSGNATWGEDVLRLDGGLAMTEMGCAEPLMQQDAWLADFLASKPTLKVERDTLVLTSGSTAVTLQDEEAAVPDKPLVGVTWRLESIQTGDAVSSVPFKATLLFDDDGEVFASDGCNSGSGRYTQQEDVVRITNYASTLMLCSGAKGEQADAVSSVLLGGQLVWQIDGDALTLTPPSGNASSSDTRTAAPTALGYRAAER